MSQKVTCPKCGLEFTAAEGLKSHIKSIEENERNKVRKEEKDKRKKEQEKLKLLENEVKKKDLEKEAAVKTALEKANKASKEHFTAQTETLLKKDREDQLNKHNEEKNKWELEKSRLNKQIQTLNQTANQGVTVDQGSASEISLGEFLKKVFKNTKDKIEEYEKGEAGGDWIQEVIEQDFSVGKILYERKNTKTWSNKWFGKLQEDMEASGSDYGIIFTRTTSKDFPKNAKFTHKGNIFVCRYDYDILDNLAQTQRHLMVQLNKERKSSSENELSALKFWEHPKVKNAMLKGIDDQSETRKQIRQAKKNLDKAEASIGELGTNLDKIFIEIDKIGLSVFLNKKKETDQKE